MRYDTIIRSFYHPAAFALHRAVDHHDGLHIDLRRGRRLLRLELRRQNAICRRQLHDAGPDDSRLSGLHVRNRRQRVDCKKARRKAARKSERHFHNADRLRGRARPDPRRARHCAFACDRPASRRGGRNAPKLRALRKDRFAGHAVLSAAILLPVPVCHGAEAEAGALCDGRRRRVQYGARRAVCRCVPLGTYGRGARDGVQPVCRRRGSARLFRKAARGEPSCLQAIPL